MIDSHDGDGFMDVQFPKGSTDRRTIQQLALGSLIQDGYRLSVQQGVAGFACASHWAVRDWGELVRGAMVPGIYLHGGQDMVNRAHRVTQAMTRWLEVQVRVLQDAGQLLFYERPDLVFAALGEIAALHR